MSCCDEAATQVGLEALKAKFEGQTRRICKNPDVDPEIFVTFDEVTRKEGGSISFNAQQFTLKNLVFKTTVEIKGSKTQLAAFAASKGALAAANKMGAGEGTQNAILSVAAKVAGVGGAAQEKLGTADSRTIKVDVTIDSLAKQMGETEVTVKVGEIITDVGIIEKVLSVEKVRNILEEAISKKATEIVTRIVAEKTNKLMEKAGVA